MKFLTIRRFICRLFGHKHFMHYHDDGFYYFEGMYLDHLCKRCDFRWEQTPAGMFSAVQSRRLGPKYELVYRMGPSPTELTPAQAIEIVKNSDIRDWLSDCEKPINEWQYRKNPQLVIVATEYEFILYCGGQEAARAYNSSIFLGELLILNLKNALEFGFKNTTTKIIKYESFAR